MGRKPNYRFERAERDRLKAAKKAERLKAKQERSASSNASADDAPAPDDLPAGMPTAPDADKE